MFPRLLFNQSRRYSTEAAKRQCLVLTSDQPVKYVPALELQRALLQDRRRPGNGLRDVLLLLEHEHVYTLGNAAKEEYLKFSPLDQEYELHRVDRGGQVTYHGPGQLVGYPILDLKEHKKDLRWYLSKVEDVLVNTLSSYGIESHPSDAKGYTGIWTNKGKIAAIGIRSSSWVTMHGFSLNINPNMSYFENIVPCGITDAGVSSMRDMLVDEDLPHPEEVRQRLIREFAKAFDVETTEAPLNI